MLYQLSLLAPFLLSLANANCPKENDLNFYGPDPICLHKLNNFEFYKYKTFYAKHEDVCFWNGDQNIDKYYQFKDVTEYRFRCENDGVKVYFCYMGRSCS